MKITGKLSADEIKAYQEYAAINHKGFDLIGIHVVDGEHIDLELVSIPFQRIRRITGYLVGTTERWNNAKMAELQDRVIHGGTE